MKLSQLLKSIEPIQIYPIAAQGTRCRAQGRDQRADKNINEHDALGAVPYANTPDPDIGSIHYRAQDVQPSGAFVAIEGSAADGHDFIDEALKRGAAVIIAQKEAHPPRLSASESSVLPARHHARHASKARRTGREPLKRSGRVRHETDGDGQVDTEAFVIQVTNTRKALANVSATFYGNPSEDLVLIGITGTNGKTTTAYLVERILQNAGYQVGVIGTINYRYAGKTFDNPITTPESLDLQRILAEMRQAGITHVVMEASSHAIELYRIQRCWLDVGVFTNLSQDHLDFHGTMESYWSSKKRLFTEYLGTGPKKDCALAVINCDNSHGRQLAQLLEMPVIKTGAGADCAVQVAIVRCDLNGIKGTISIPEGLFDFTSRLVGEHNVENILCAAGVATAFTIPLDHIKAGVEAVSHIPGRLERIENDAERFVYVDYAHTPDALKNVICALRGMTTNRIICVFGCGGDRDKEKRPVMGEIAAKYCDLSIVTSDNPRTEDPLAIIDHILEGTKRANGFAYSIPAVKTGFDNKGFVVEPDRRCAIKLGITVSRPGDTVLIAGKGHEPYQIFGNTKVPFDDRQEARSALRVVSS
ncbi:MAG: UDP-N-acetylmuramoyl-L-alanyl-D-glutamate--2,6-diaminopimelate ligase [Desulfobacterales bacterium]|nr:MAG: UDP-N-acetylmuramoyl-L-alanyl-D-glutamate--2,6-diaminopimelate ligase [Desulfobacterales bacterium]